MNTLAAPAFSQDETIVVGQGASAAFKFELPRRKSGYWSKVAQQEGIDGMIDDSCHLGAESDHLPWDCVNNEDAELHTVAVVLQNFSEAVAASIVSDVVRD
jgi:hypothetical protein